MDQRPRMPLVRGPCTEPNVSHVQPPPRMPGKAGVARLKWQTHAHVAAAPLTSSNGHVLFKAASCCRLLLLPPAAAFAASSITVALLPAAGKASLSLGLDDLQGVDHLLTHGLRDTVQP